MVLLVADMKELKANPNKQAKGVVIEARLDKSRGPIASVLVQRGTLDTGDTVIVMAGFACVKIRIFKRGSLCIRNFLSGSLTSSCPLQAL
jgi:translation initiation factor IF-2